MLRENLHDHDEKLKKANEIAAEICSQSSHEESSMINEKMATLNVRWTQIKRSIDEPRWVNSSFFFLFENKKNLLT